MGAVKNRAYGTYFHSPRYPDGFLGVFNQYAPDKIQITMKILVVNEPFVPGFCRTQRWAARTRGRVLRAPDWLAYATAVLERDIPDAKVTLYDFPAMSWEKDKLREILKQENPDFVVLDSTT